MRADGAAGVDVDVRAGVTVPAVPWLWIGLLSVGGVLVVPGALLVARGVHPARSGPAGPRVSAVHPTTRPIAPTPRPAPAVYRRSAPTPGIQRELAESGG
jgi:hypothetical protein